MIEVGQAILLTGDSLEMLRLLPDKSIQCCVTSPPYYGLRDYGTGKWEGGDPACDHVVGEMRRGLGLADSPASTRGGAKKIAECDDIMAKAECPKCGARRIDAQMGLEETPQAYVDKLVAVFREVHRALRDDGTVWLNLGDSYAANRGYQVPSTKGGPKHGPGQSAGGKGSAVPDGMKPKDLLGIPWRVAFALQADGWYLRQDIIWAKPNCMPESVTDRCTKSHEYLFLLTKSERYYFDSEAIKQPASDSYKKDKRWGRGKTETNYKEGYAEAMAQNPKQPHGVFENAEAPARVNRRSVWWISPKPFKGAHFATFPPDLIEPCIMGGTSEKGACPHCGTPWHREVVKRTSFEGGSGAAGRTAEEVNASGKWQNSGDAGNENLKLGPVNTTTTTGWRPTCEHYPRATEWPDIPRQDRDESDADYATRIAPITALRADLLAHYAPYPTVPQYILDPFGGAATAGLVANRLGRNSVLIELNPKYVEIARERLTKDHVDRNLSNTLQSYAV